MIERSRPRPPRVLRFSLGLILAMLYLPLVAMVAASANDAGVLSWRWYAEVFADPVLAETLMRSLIVASVSSFASTALGLVGATALERWRFRAGRPLEALATLSLMLPELVLALSLLSWFALFGVPLSLATVTIAHVTLTLPFATLVIGARLRGLDRAIDDAARDLGASEAQVFTRITLPLLVPALLTAFLLAFLLSFDDFLVTFYTNGAGGDTLPVRLYSLMKTGLTPKVQALSSLMLAGSLALIGGLFAARGTRDLT